MGVWTFLQLQTELELSYALFNGYPNTATNKENKHSVQPKIDKNKM